MSLVSKAPNHLHVTLKVDTVLFDEAMRNAIAALNRYLPLAQTWRLARQRDRSRLVTRRKQRNRW